ncbi:MAG: hypothetical protein J6S85_09480 [Methanobrevibacter sp.]|nr:hypothetical protein [Methanobrevibacter sp.]
MTKAELENEAEEYAEGTKTEKEIEVLNTVHDWGQESLSPSERRLFEGIQDRDRARKQGFKDGAEFGYNKAMKELECLKDCSNCKHWHYSTRSLSYYCDKTGKSSDSERQCYRCEYWEY